MEIKPLEIVHTEEQVSTGAEKQQMSLSLWMRSRLTDADEERYQRKLENISS
jgi:hypothetical protein